MPENYYNIVLFHNIWKLKVYYRRSTCFIQKKELQQLNPDRAQ